MLNEKQIADNWDKLIKFIEDTFDGDRKKNLLELYNDNSERIAMAPAANKIYFHSAFIGGYVHHVLNVIAIAPRMSKLWESLTPVRNYTEEELLFVALNHDLGKIGDDEHEYYINNESDWHVKRGTIFDFHPELQYMKVQQRSLYLLQHYGIKVNRNEYLGILLHDGLYDDGNKPYYINYDPKFFLRTMLPYVIWFADMFAFKREYYEWAESPEGKKFLSSGQMSSIKTDYKKKATAKKISDVLQSENKSVDIDEIFNSKSFEELFEIKKEDK